MWHTLGRGPARSGFSGRCSIGKQAAAAKTPDRVEAARQFAIEAARTAAHTRCHNVVVLDVRGLSPVTDYFVIATGTSPRQMRTVADEIAEMGAERDYAPLTTTGAEGESWILIDFVDVIVHVFNQDSRLFYDLEALWGDAKRVKWDPEGKTP